MHFRAQCRQPHVPHHCCMLPHDRPPIHHHRWHPGKQPLQSSAYIRMPLDTSCSPISPPSFPPIHPSLPPIIPTHPPILSTRPPTHAPHPSLDHTGGILANSLYRVNLPSQLVNCLVMAAPGPPPPCSAACGGGNRTIAQVSAHTCLGNIVSV